MRLTKGLTLISTAILLLGINPAHGQRTLSHADRDKAYKSGLELFQKQKYVAAQHEFDQIINGHGKQDEIRIRSEFYYALSSIELFHGDAENRIKSFIENHSESNLVPLANFHYGVFLYRKKKFEEAVPVFEKTDPSRLTNAQRAEYYFKYGYSLFHSDNREKALNYFAEVKEVENPYRNSAIYYYSHIQYGNKKYDIALKGFSDLKGDEQFGAIVPYYISQIYFLQKKYDEVISYAPPLLDSSNTKRVPEIAHLIASSYYQKKQYKESLPFYETFLSKSNMHTRDDHYEYGFASYKTGNYSQAVKHLQDAAKEKDSLGQIALYNLGNCNLQLKDKKAARNNFLAASKLSFDPSVKEESLFSFAKLSYELAQNPFNEAVNAINSYLTEYPSSERKSEAYELLINIYLNTHNYSEALKTLEGIPQRNIALDLAYQKIAYLHGIEKFNDGELEESIKLLDKSLGMPKDKIITALAQYWKSEALYRLKRTDEAIDQYTKFIYMPGALTTGLLNEAHYSLGYALLDKKDYAGAATWFRKFTGNDTEKNQQKLNDAHVRTGDCYYVTREFDNATFFYSEALKIKNKQNDYALFQKASAIGLAKKYDQKISSLNQLITEYPNSVYLDDARYELGNTYLIQNNNDKAREQFSYVISQYPNSEYFRKSLSKLGLIYFNSDENAKALEIQKQLLAKFPGTEESKQALNMMKNIYVEEGNMAEFDNFIKSTPNLNVSTASLDTAAFESGENQFMKGDYKAASRELGFYLEKYPQGIFARKAHAFKAESDLKLNNTDQALVHFSYLAFEPRNQYSERSALMAARLSRKKNDANKAAEFYRILKSTSENPTNLQEAQQELANIAWEQKNWTALRTENTELRKFEKLSPQLLAESHYRDGKSWLEEKNDSLARLSFELVVGMSKNEMAAESRFRIAEIQFRKAQLDACEKSVFDLADMDPAYDLWVAKAFILLADTYWAKGNNFQAKQTLQSIVDNYDGEDLKKEAAAKLEAFVKEEAERERKLREELRPEINIEIGNPDDEQLFQEINEKQ